MSPITIANPMYDVVFKHLMSDLSIAKGILAAIIEENIVEIDFKSQENVYHDNFGVLKIYRLDFFAKIKTAGGQYKNVIIEIQQAKLPADIMRFRNYLGEQYKKEDHIPLTQPDKRGKTTKKQALPIIAIFILGFTLSETLPAAMKVSRLYTDLLKRQPFQERHAFIEGLTHDAYFIQVKQLNLNLKTRLEWVLSIFEQRYFITSEDKKVKVYKAHPADPFIQNIVKKLHVLTQDVTVMRQVALEEQAAREYALGIEKREAELMEVIEEKEKTIEEKEKTIEKKEKTIEEKKRALEQKDKALAEQQKQLELYKQLIEQLKNK